MRSSPWFFQCFELRVWSCWHFWLRDTMARQKMHIVRMTTFSKTWKCRGNDVVRKQYTVCCKLHWCVVTAAGHSASILPVLRILRLIKSFFILYSMHGHNVLVPSMVIGWRNVWNMRWRALDQEVDQRGHGKRLCKKIAKHVIWTRRMLWIVIDGRSW